METSTLLIQIRDHVNTNERLLSYLGDEGLALAPPITFERPIPKSKNSPPILPARDQGKGMDGEDPAQVSRAASALATLHILASRYADQPNLASSFIKSFRNELALFFDDLEHLGATLDDLKIAGSLKLFRSLAVQLERLFSNLGYERLPKLFIHGNYTPPNVTIDGERVRILELDGTRYEARVLDIAIALSHLTPGAYDSAFLDSTTVFFTSYDETLPLSGPERAALPVLIAVQIAREAFEEIRSIAKSLDQTAAHRHAGMFRGQVGRLWWIVENWNKLQCIFAGSQFVPANYAGPTIQTRTIEEEDLDQQ